MLAFTDFVHTILSYFEYEKGIFFMNFFSGISILPMIYLYMSSYSFKFCGKHRMPLHYVVVSNLIALYDSYQDIPLDDKQYLYVYFILTGVFIFIYLFYDQIYKKCLK